MDTILTKLIHYSVSLCVSLRVDFPLFFADITNKVQRLQTLCRLGFDSHPMVLDVDHKRRINTEEKAKVVFAAL